MSDFHSDCKRQLVTAAGALFAAPAASRELEISRPRRIPLLAIIVLAALLLAAAALGATQIIGFGAPVAPSHAPGRERPSATTGIGLPVAGGEGSPASAQPLAISVPDPRGGLPWGMRIVRTTRGLLCPQIGRLLDGRLGVLGEDGEFNDDGLFHELPASVLEPNTCIAPSAWTILSDVGVPAAGALQSATTSCLAPWLRARASLPPHCPAGDERLIGFGVLGPHAVSVSYMVDGRLRTVATAGRLGAYLVVLRVPPKLAHNAPALGGKSGLLGGFPIGAGQGEVVSRLQFRFHGHLCQTGFDRQPGGPPQCTSRLAGQPMLVPRIPRGLRTPVALQARRAPGGYELEVTFTAPAAVTDASIAYGVQVTRPSSPACGRGGIWGQSIERDVARGQRLHVSEFVPQPRGCHGIVKGQVLLGAGTGALRLLGGRDETIGRFSFEMR
ncbi:MAG: hypothetical protein JWN10_2587 [Solirubrobacterales bacterium]|nr:hypothetical protein [Solirubrobacterales bacterium]